ncbi:MAG: radical SAM protein [Candidatus Omnitrophica bacterium]|nr:radical SAM protein [Candidatus Omnitrophota bacterium]
MEFCQSYKNQVNIPFGCVAIPEYLNKGKIEALGSSGCYHVQMGVQSLNEEICSQVLKRGLDRAKISEAIYLLRNAGIVVQVDHMLGIPGDTIGLEEESVLFYNKFRPHVIGTYWLAYYPKTKITETARLKGLVSEQDIVEMNEGRGRFTIKNPSHNSADSKRYGPYYGILVLLQYLPLLPRWLVRFIVKRKLYQVFALKNYFIAALIPSLFLAFSHPKNFIYRKHFNWFINRLFYKAKLA